MNNVDIAEIIELAGKLLELHDQDEARAKTYAGSVYNLERLDENLAEMTETELLKIRGIGKLMASNILEIVRTGKLAELENLIAQTPPGVFEMFKVKGLGVKKIKVLWTELGIDNLNELKIACTNGKIAGIKGFGEKTQQSILEALVFLQSQEGKLRMDKAAYLSREILSEIQKLFPQAIEVGQVKRNCETVDCLQFMIPSDQRVILSLPKDTFVQNFKISSPGVWRGNYAENKVKIEILTVKNAELVSKSILFNASEKHLQLTNAEGQFLLKHLQTGVFESEEQAYSTFGMPYIVPEMREGNGEFEWAANNKNEDLITWSHLKGSLHNHSTYSDGRHTLREMAEFCRSLGLEYFGIADHSQTATYAQGLTAGDVVKQQEEIDKLNAGLAPFKILKGIESDILINGDLDYEPEILATFDYVVASVHAVLGMDIEKATARLIKAIENPYTTILGHPTGRLLLSRSGYPLHFKKIIDACAANQVVMEINASPYRLDLDWRWISYCLEKEVMLSINPDAHETAGFYDMNYGVAVARKGGLTWQKTFNALSLKDMEAYLLKKRGITV